MQKKINLEKLLYSKAIGNNSLRIINCLNKEAIECLGLCSEEEFLNCLITLILSGKYEEKE